MSNSDRTRQYLGSACVSSLVVLMSCFLPWVCWRTEIPFSPWVPKELVGETASRHFLALNSSISLGSIQVENWMVGAYVALAALIMCLQSGRLFPPSKLIPFGLLVLAFAHTILAVVSISQYASLGSGPIVALIGSFCLMGSALGVWTVRTIPARPTDASATST